jgi:hypothetical protein
MTGTTCANKFFVGLYENGGTNTPSDYKYIGGDTGYHLTYLKQTASKIYPFLLHENLPESHQCVCGQHIHENCYLLNLKTNKIVVVGNCCIKRYTPNEAIKRCLLCNTPKKHMKGGICTMCKIPSSFDDYVVSFGKHKGNTFKNVLIEQFNYCSWILSNNFFKDKNTPLYRYLKYHS